jgi:tRNA (guanine-N7-)-methyltransferase
VRFLLESTILGAVADDHPRRQLHGRVKGKKLRPGQSRLMDELLPRVCPPDGAAPIDPTALFGFPFDQLIVEIGFGGGEHLADEATANPMAAFIGCEPFVNGVAKMLARIDQGGFDNVRVHKGDALDILKRLPTGGVDRVDLLYPDPWPKWRQRKRRFVSEESLVEIARVLKPGGEFRFASDIDDYVGWTLARVLPMPAFKWTAVSSADWLNPWPGYRSTRYEQKAKREGRPSSYLTFVRM